MIKAYMCVNQFNDLKHIYTMAEFSTRLRDNAKDCRKYQQLDEKVIELQIDVKKEDVKDPVKTIDFDEYEPGLYKTSPGWYFFKGDPKLIKEIRTVTPSSIDDSKIPRVTVVAVVDKPEILLGEYWWNAKELQSLIDRFKPKWMCKGYLREIVGKDKVRIDYVPVSINEGPLASLVKDLFEGLSKVGDQIEGIFEDHGSNQEIELLDL